MWVKIRQQPWPHCVQKSHLRLKKAKQQGTSGDSKSLVTTSPKLHFQSVWVIEVPFCHSFSWVLVTYSLEFCLVQVVPCQGFLAMVCGWAEVRIQSPWFYLLKLQGSSTGWVISDKLQPHSGLDTRLDCTISKVS